MTKFTKEFLNSVLEDETKTKEEKAEAIFAVRGKEIAEKNKAFKDLELELSNIKETYTSPEDLAVIVEEKTALTGKLNKIEGIHLEEINKVKFDYAFADKIKSVGAKDVKLLKAVLDMDKISYEDGEIKGLDEQMEMVNEKYSYLLETEEKPKPGFSRKFNLGETGSMTKDEFKALPPTKRTELFRTDPDLYKQLSN